MRPTISVVVPVFNAEATLPELVSHLERTLSDAADEFEVLLVNDASRDRSWETIRRLGTAYGWVRGIDLARNYGQHNAVLAGIRAARYEIVVTMDDDLQHPPEEIPRLLSKLAEGYDVVYGTPLTRRHGRWRGAAARVTRLLLQGPMGVDVAGRQSAFRAFRTAVRDGFADHQSPGVFVDGLLAWSAGRFAAVDVRHDARPGGRSNYTALMLGRHAINMISGFTTLPLRLAGLLGFAGTILGALGLLYVAWRRLVVGAGTPDVVFPASLIAIFGGVQLLTLGIVGEYLARLYLTSLGRPPYRVRARTEDTPTDVNG